VTRLTSPSLFLSFVDFRGWSFPFEVGFKTALARRLLGSGGMPDAFSRGGPWWGPPSRLRRCPVAVPFRFSSKDYPLVILRKAKDDRRLSLLHSAALNKICFVTQHDPAPLPSPPPQQITHPFFPCQFTLLRWGPVCVFAPELPF